MAKKGPSMRKTQEIIRLLLRENRSIREIAVSSNVPRSTVSDYAQRAQASGLRWEDAEKMTEPELRRRLFPARTAESPARPLPDYAAMRTELSKKGVTLQLLWQEYREANPDGYGYSQYCKLYDEWAEKCDLVMRQEHKAGEKLFVDFSGKTMPIIDAVTGEVKLEAQIFVAVLGASNYTFALATPSQKVADWLDAHVKAFRFLNGIPAVLVPDNLKSAVRSPDWYEPDLNPSYQDLATHYGCAVIPARVRKPRDKAAVEIGVQIVQRWILAALRKRAFYSLGELNEAIAVLLDVFNRKPFKKLPGNRYTRFLELDQPALRPLPATDYEMAEWKRATVNIDYHIEFEKHRYSVPYQLVGETVDVRYTARTVEILLHGQRVAAHKRNSHVGGFSTLEAHRPKAHQKTEWTPSRLIHWGGQIGPETGAFVERLLVVRPHPEQGFRSALALLKLAKEFSPPRLEAACKMALAMNVASAKVVKNILRAGRDKAEPKQTELNLPQDHENIVAAIAITKHLITGEIISPAFTEGEKPMMNEQTMEKLHKMRLAGMAAAIRRQEEQRGEYAALSFEERFGLVVDEEWTTRESQKLSTRLKNAKFKQTACVEDVNYRHPRGLDRGLFRELARCKWVADKKNVLITGKAGVGKSYLAQALANQACREGYTARYIRLSRLLRDMHQARIDGSDVRLLRALGKVRVLVIDDWGLTPIGDPERRDILEVVEERHGSGATVVTSQLPVKNWHAYIGDNTIADAIMDRLTPGSHRLHLDGKSLRDSEATLQSEKEER